MGRLLFQAGLFCISWIAVYQLKYVFNCPTKYIFYPERMMGSLCGNLRW